jgi:Ribonuclease G/E
MMKSIEERVHELLRVIEKEAKIKNPNKTYVYICHVYVHQLLAQYLLNVQFDSLLFFEKMYQVKVVVTEEATVRLDAFHFEWVLKKEA